MIAGSIPLMAAQLEYNPMLATNGLEAKGGK
jgi:hypothetical protein